MVLKRDVVLWLKLGRPIEFGSILNDLIPNLITLGLSLTMKCPLLLLLLLLLTLLIVTS